MNEEDNDISEDCLTAAVSSSSSSSSSRAGLALSSLCVAQTVAHLRRLSLQSNPHSKSQSKPQSNTQSNLSVNQWARKLSRWLQPAVQFLALASTTGKPTTLSKTMAPLLTLQSLVEMRMMAVMSRVLCDLSEGGGGDGGGDSTREGVNVRGCRRVLFAVLR